MPWRIAGAMSERSCQLDASVSKSPNERDHHGRGHRRDRPETEREEGPPPIWGIHAVEAALSNPRRRLNKLWLTDNAAHRLEGPLAACGIAAERVHPKDLDRRLGADTVHQGALLEADALPEIELAELAERAVDQGPLVVLDQVTDPHNVGAILRSCAVFGAAGLVMTRRNSPPLGGALAKAASGALEHVPVALIQNLARSLAQVKDAGLTVIGLDGEAASLLEDADFKGGVAVVLGAEGKGLRQLTRESCSRICSISTGGALSSLNVSNAAAIALHLAAMRRRGR